MRCPVVLLLVTLCFGVFSAVAQAPDPVKEFERALAAAIKASDRDQLSRLIPILDDTLLRAILQTPSDRVGIIVHMLGPVGPQTLVYVRLEDKIESHSIELFQSLGELVLRNGQPVLARDLSAREAANSFRIASHYSVVEMDANTGATNILDHVEISILKPTRWVFFFLDPDRTVSSVAIEAGNSEVFRAGNFVALERNQPWRSGDRIRLTVRSHQRGAGTKS